MEIESTSYPSLDTSLSFLDEPNSQVVGGVTDSKVVEQFLAERQVRREQFELQGDSHSTWIELEAGGAVPGSQPSSTKATSLKKLHFLRLDTPLLQKPIRESHVKGPAKRAGQHRSVPDAIGHGVETPFVVALLPGKLLASDDVKSSLDTNNASELNRSAAIRALELVEHHQELWLKNVTDYKLTTPRS